MGQKRGNRNRAARNRQLLALRSRYQDDVDAVVDKFLAASSASGKPTTPILSLRERMFKRPQFATATKRARTTTTTRVYATAEAAATATATKKKKKKKHHHSAERAEEQAAIQRCRVAYMLAHPDAKFSLTPRSRSRLAQLRRKAATAAAPAATTAASASGGCGGGGEEAAAGVGAVEGVRAKKGRVGAKQWKVKKEEKDEEDEVEL
eukprot:TRINITY_DN1571_c0_g1_i6.p1 TRINITY_DN1571_c0_g1~~TRINITY_DN1571_c0_g1_i6.p1  ORF type:complete len:207 (+),score=80.53 TRINITY_DN1571_c0_g1_i6:39-659(+)